jgi:type I restriction enzyme S subunit
MGGGRRFVARVGQLILSRIDARNGAIGIVPRELDGSVVTNDFPLFDVNPDKLDPAFLDWLSRTKEFVELCRRASEGTTNRVRLQEERFLAVEIPLPPLAEQRRVVARVEELAGKVAEAAALRQTSQQDAAALLKSETERAFSNLRDRFGSKVLASLNPHVTSGPRNWGQYYASDGSRFYRAQDIGPGGTIVDVNIQHLVPPVGAQGRSARPQPGDLLIVITGATVGRVALFRACNEHGFVSQHVAICRLPQSVVLPEFVLWGLLGPDGQRQLVGQRYGQGKPGLNLDNIRRLALPLPPISEQQRVVEYLERVRACVGTLCALQEQTADELAIMLPSILDKAFMGGLTAGSP